VLLRLVYLSVKNVFHKRGTAQAITEELTALVEEAARQCHALTNGWPGGEPPGHWDSRLFHPLNAFVTVGVRLRYQTGRTPASAAHLKPGRSAGAARPWPSVKRRQCAPTVLTVRTDRPDSTDARPPCVRRQRNMTVYSATR